MLWVMKDVGKRDIFRRKRKLILSRHGILYSQISMKHWINFNIFWEKTRSVEIFSRGHKNLKELIAPSKIALRDDCEQRGNSKRQYQGKCVKCGGRGKSVRGRKRFSGIHTCKVLEENTEFKSTQIIRLDKI